MKHHPIMMQRRTFIHKASFGFLLFGHPGFISGITSEKNSFSTLAQDIISTGKFKPVSLIEYDPRVDRIISREAESLIKLGYKADNSGYLISSDRKQVLSLFSMSAANQNRSLAIAMVLEKSGKSWKLVHSIDTFEIQARSKAINDFTDQPNPEINNSAIVSIPKLNESTRKQEKDKPCFVCKTTIDGNSAKTYASIVQNQKSIWSKELNTDL